MGFKYGFRNVEGTPQEDSCDADLFGLGFCEDEQLGCWAVITRDKETGVIIEDPTHPLVCSKHKRQLKAGKGVR